MGIIPPLPAPRRHFVGASLTEFQFGFHEGVEMGERICDHIAFWQQFGRLGTWALLKLVNRLDAISYTLETLRDAMQSGKATADGVQIPTGGSGVLAPPALCEHGKPLCSEACRAGKLGNIPHDGCHCAGAKMIEDYWQRRNEQPRIGRDGMTTYGGRTISGGREEVISTAITTATCGHCGIGLPSKRCGLGNRKCGILKMADSMETWPTSER